MTKHSRVVFYSGSRAKFARSKSARLPVATLHATIRLHAFVLAERHRHPSRDRAVILGCAGRRATAAVACLFACVARDRVRFTCNGLGTAVSAAARSQYAGRGDAAVSEGTLLRRICVRLVLGRCLPAAWSALLSKAASGDSVYTRHRTAAAGPQQTGKAAFARRRAGASGRRAPLVAPCSVPGCRRRCAMRGGGPVDARQPSVSLAKPRLPRLRRFPVD